MGVDLPGIRDDLRAEQAELRELLLAIDADAWDIPSAAPGWTVRHQVRHLAHGEELGRLSIVDPTGFAAALERMLDDLDAVEAATTAPEREAPSDLVARWWDAAEGLRAAEAAGPADVPLDWIAGPMGRASFLTARLMETFAHGHDIAVGVGAKLPATARLRHIAHLGVATRRFAFANRGLEPPAGEVRVELAAPDGATWTWGPTDAPDRVSGDALDFCLLVTQRIHRDDARLEASGDAERWLAIAQCFAGPPTDGPPPR